MSTTEEPLTTAPSWAQFDALYRRVSAEVGQRLAEVCGLTLPEYAVLALFADQHCTTHRMADLAKQVDVSASTATRLVARLESKGLLRRCPNPDDGRGVLAERTPAGTALLRQAAEVVDSTTSRLVTPEALLPRQDSDLANPLHP